MTDYISVVIPTYNPDPKRLDQTLSGLRRQHLPLDQWELIIIDNNSTVPIQPDLSWHSNSCIATESRQGLTYARLKGFNISKGNIIILVDDDNILDKDYLQQVLFIFKGQSKLGACGGKSLPLFEASPPEWLNNFYGNLALRDFGNQIILEKWKNKYPKFAPIGAGMALKKNALKSYIDKLSNGKSIFTDRTGVSLSSGGDNDIVIEILKTGFTVGYFPALKLQHIIPPERMSVKYLARLINNTNKSWVQLLENHGINPWRKISKWTIPLRKIKAWFTYKAWKSETNYIYWEGACGKFDGLANKL